MFGKRFLCTLVVLAVVCSIAVVVVPSGCWPCGETTCGDLTGWTKGGSGQCQEVRFNRCLNDNCTTYAPQYDDCYVLCRWQTWTNGGQECFVITQNTEFCAQ